MAKTPAAVPKSGTRSKKDVGAVAKPPHRKIHYNLRHAADRLDVSEDYLSRLPHRLYRPVAKRGRITIYTAFQIDLISMAWRGLLTEDEAYARLSEADDQELKSVERKILGLEPVNEPV